MRLALYGNHLYKLFETHKKKFLYIPLGLYWLLIFVLTSIPGRSLPKIILGLSDKAKHLGAYLILGFLLSFTLHFQKKYVKLKKYYALSTFFIIFFYGLFDEIHQMFIPGRYFEWLDFLSDLIGALIGIFVAKWIIDQNDKINK